MYATFYVYNAITISVDGKFTSGWMLTKSYAQLKKLHDDLSAQFAKAGMIPLPDPPKRVCCTVEKGLTL